MESERNMPKRAGSLVPDGRQASTSPPPVLMGDSDSDAEVEEDPRIVKLYSFAEKQCNEDGLYALDKGTKFAEFLDECGTADATVCGGIWAGPANLCRAYFAVAALVDAEEMAVSKCVELKRAPLKACVKAGGEGAGVSLLAALERYTTTDVEDEKLGVKAWVKMLQALWEWEIVAEEDIRAWHTDERAAGRLQVSPVKAQDLRERSLAFFEWLEQAE